MTLSTAFARAIAARHSTNQQCGAKTISYNPVPREIWSPLQTQGYHLMQKTEQAHHPLEQPHLGEFFVTSEAVDEDDLLCGIEVAPSQDGGTTSTEPTTVYLADSHCNSTLPSAASNPSLAANGNSNIDNMTAIAEEDDGNNKEEHQMPDYSQLQESIDCDDFVLDEPPLFFFRKPPLRNHAMGFSSPIYDLARGFKRKRPVSTIQKVLANPPGSLEHQSIPQPLVVQNRSSCIEKKRHLRNSEPQRQLPLQPHQHPPQRPPVHQWAETIFVPRTRNRDDEQSESDDDMPCNKENSELEPSRHSSHSKFYSVQPEFHNPQDHSPLSLSSRTERTPAIITPSPMRCTTRGKARATTSHEGDEENAQRLLTRDAYGLRISCAAAPFLSLRLQMSHMMMMDRSRHAPMTASIATDANSNDLFQLFLVRASPGVPQPAYTLEDVINRILHAIEAYTLAHQWHPSQCNEHEESKTGLSKRPALVPGKNPLTSSQGKVACHGSTSSPAAISSAFSLPKCHCRASASTFHSNFSHGINPYQPQSPIIIDRSDPSPANSTASSALSRSLFKDAELRELMCAIDGESKNQVTESALLFPDLDEWDLGGCESDDGLDDELGALTDIEKEIQKELCLADTLVNSAALLDKALTASDDDEDDLVDQSLLLHDDGDDAVHEAIAQHDRTTVKTALAAAVEDRCAADDQMLLEAMDEFDLEDVDLKDNDDNDECCEGDDFAADPLRKTVRFSDFTEEHYYLQEQQSRGGSSDEESSSILDDIYHVLEDLVEEMSLACIKSMPRSRPVSSNTRTLSRSNVFYC